MSKDTASRVRALAWSTKMRGLQRGWRCGGGTGGWVWGLWKRGRLQWLASIDLLCAAILPPFATGVDHPLPPHPLVRRYRPLQPPTQPSTHLTPRGRGRHFEKWFRKSSWPGTSFFNRPFFFLPATTAPSLFRHATPSSTEGRKSVVRNPGRKKKANRNVQETGK